jgi:plastocyanin
MRRSTIALVSAVGATLLVPAMPLAAEEPPAAPAAVLEAASNSVVAGTPLKLDSSRSSGAAPIVGHEWDLDGDGSFEKDTGTEPTAELTPESDGPLTVHVRVKDDRGQTGEAALDLTVTAPPAPAPAPTGGKTLDTKTSVAGDVPAGGDGSGGAQGKAPPSGAEQPPAPALATAEAPKAPPASGDPAEPEPADASPPPADASPAPADASPPPAPPVTGLRMSAVNTSLVPRPSLVRASKSATKGFQLKTRVVSAAASGVTIKNFKFAPASISVHVGDSVSWTNQDSTAHTATASDGSFDTGALNKGKSGSHTFTKAGTVAYICSIHPFMKGTVVVTAASGGGAPGSGSGGDSTATPGSSSPSTDSGGLPQTGLNLAAVVLLAFMLSGSGTLLRWRLDR